jgi:hypothetical protein
LIVRFGFVSQSHFFFSVIQPLLEKYTSKKGLFKKSSARDVDAAPPSPSPPGGPVRTPSSGSLLTNSGGAPPPNSNPDYVSSALLQGNYNAVNAVTYSQLHPDAVTGGGPPGLGAAPAPPGLGAPPAVPSKGGPPPGAPARTPSLTNATAATAAAAAAKPVEYKSLSDVKKIAPVVYDAKLGDQAGKTEEKAPVTYESSMEAMKRGAPAPVVYDAKLDADGISAEDLAALDEMAAGLGSDDEDDDPPRAPDDADEPVAASPPVAAAAPTPAAPAAGAAPVIAKPRGALPIPTRGAPPSVPARGATPPVTIAKPRGPLPTPAARGASPQPGIAKPRGPLPTPVRAGAPAPAGGLAMPALPAAAIAGGIVLEPLSDEESD